LPPTCTRSVAGRTERVLRVLLAAVLLAAPGCADEQALSEDPPETVLFESITRPGEGGGAVHLVRLLQSGDRYGFDPDELRVTSGDVLRFVMVGSQPESVVFDPNAATPEAAVFIRSQALNRGVLLTEPGQVYDVSFRDAPAGRYPFHSLPHEVHGMRGVVEVVE
jgi:plastocyanin